MVEKGTSEVKDIATFGVYIQKPNWYIVLLDRIRNR